ncbi:hypothetical protein D3C76_766820 [compost metagenome]
MAQSRNLVAQGGGIHRRVSLHIGVAAADGLQQLVDPHELLVEGVAVARQVAHAHQFDEAQFEALLQGVIQQRQHLVEVVPAQRHHVQLDLQPGGLRLGQPLQHRRQVAATGDAAETVGIQGIQGNVQPAYAAFEQQRQLARDQLAVAGQADVRQAETADAVQEGIELGTDQRFAAGDTQPLDTGRLDQIGHGTCHGLGGKFVLGGDQTLAVRHAVGAGVVAGGGQADAQVAEAPALAIDDHRRLRRTLLKQYMPAVRALRAPVRIVNGDSGGGWRVAVALALVAHAHADIHEELEEAFLILQYLAPERRVIQRHRAMHQGPRCAVVEVRRHVFQLAVGDAFLDQLVQPLEVGFADAVQFVDHLRYLAGLHHLLFQAVEQPVTLRVAHAEFEVGARQRFLVARYIFRMEQRSKIALIVEHQPQIDLSLRLEVLVDGAFADTDGIGDHFDRDTVFALLKEQLEGGIEDFLLATTKFANLARLFLHKKTVLPEIVRFRAGYYAYSAPNCTDRSPYE